MNSLTRNQTIVNLTRACFVLDVEEIVPTIKYELFKDVTDIRRSLQFIDPRSMTVPTDEDNYGNGGII